MYASVAAIESGSDQSVSGDASRDQYSNGRSLTVSPDCSDNQSSYKSSATDPLPGDHVFIRPSTRDPSTFDALSRIVSHSF